MERLRELLLKWDEGIISRDEAEELKTLLQDPENRREMVEELFLTGEISEFLKEEKSIPEKSKFSEEVSVTSSGRILRQQRKSGKWKPGIVWASAAACLVIAAGAFLYNLYEAGRTDELIHAKLIEIKGGITINRDGNRIPGAESTELYSGDRIETGKGARVNVKYSNEETSISILEKTRIEFRQEDGAKKIKLDQGSISCTVAPQPKDKKAVIQTPQAELKILGTVFSLYVNKENGTFLDVAEGNILLTDTATGDSAEVSSGSTASVNTKEAKPVPRGTPGKIARTIGLDNYYMGMAFDGKVLWVSRGGRRANLWKIDPETGKKIGSLKTSVKCQGLDWDGIHLWTVDGSKVYAIDTETGKAVKTFEGPRDKNGNAPYGVTAGNGVLWVVSSNTIFLLDKEDGKVLGSINGQTSTNVIGITYLRDAIWTRAYKAEYKPKIREWIKTYGLCKLDPETGRKLLFADAPGTPKEGWGSGFSNTDATHIWVLNSIQKKAYRIETGEASITELQNIAGADPLVSLPKTIDTDEFWSVRSRFKDDKILFKEAFESRESFTKDWTRYINEGGKIIKKNKNVSEDYVGIIQTERNGKNTSVLRFDSKGADDRVCGIYKNLPGTIHSFSAQGRLQLAGIYTKENEAVEGSLNIAGIQYPDKHRVVTLYQGDISPLFLNKIKEWVSFRVDTMRFKDAAGRTAVDMRLFINNSLVLWNRTYAEWAKEKIIVFFAQSKGSLYLDDIVIREMVRLKQVKTKPKELDNPNTKFKLNTQSVFK
ncbi:FecR domain-containing protein [Planctomycetota bacterium]